MKTRMKTKVNECTIIFRLISVVRQSSDDISWENSISPFLSTPGPLPLTESLTINPLCSYNSHFFLPTPQTEPLIAHKIGAVLQGQ